MNVVFISWDGFNLKVKGCSTMSVAQFIETRGSLISHSSFSLDIHNQCLMGVVLRSVSAGNSRRLLSNGIYQADCYNGAAYTRF